MVLHSADINLIISLLMITVSSGLFLVAQRSVHVGFCKLR